MRVGSVDQPHVESQRRAVDELAQKRGDDVGRYAPEPLAGKVDVGDEQRLIADFERDVRERFSRRHNGGPMPAQRFSAQRLRERLAERAAGCAHLFLGVAGSNFEREVERGVAREQAEQVIQNGDAGRDVRVAASFHRHAHPRTRVVRSIGRRHSSASVPHGFTASQLATAAAGTGRTRGKKVKTILGQADSFHRLRVGDHRIMYDIISEDHVLLVLGIVHRSDLERWLRSR